MATNFRRRWNRKRWNQRPHNVTEQLKALYSPLIGYTFEAEYFEDYNDKNVLKVSTSSYQDQFEDVMKSLEGETVNGKEVWTGIIYVQSTYRIYVKKNDKLSRIGRSYKLRIESVRFVVPGQRARYGAFANISIRVLSPEEEMYFPLINLEFAAKYEGRKRNKSTRYYRELWKVRRSSEVYPTLNRIIQQKQQQRKEFWLGFTSKLNSHTLWVNPKKQISRWVPEYAEGVFYKCRINSICAFDTRAKKYEKGINIDMVVCGRVEADDCSSTSCGETEDDSSDKEEINSALNSSHASSDDNMSDEDTESFVSYDSEWKSDDTDYQPFESDGEGTCATNIDDYDREISSSSDSQSKMKPPTPRAKKRLLSDSDDSEDEDMASMLRKRRKQRQKL